MQDLIKKFNIEIKKKTKLYKEEITHPSKYYYVNNSQTDNYNIPIKKNNTITEMIIELDKNNHKFTKDHFSDFIVQITYGRYKSYLTGTSKKTNKKRRNEVLKIMFKQWFPTNMQLVRMLNCNGINIDSRKFQGNFDWLIFLKDAFGYTDENLQFLMDCGLSPHIVEMLLGLNNGLKIVLKIKSDGFLCGNNDSILKHIQHNKIKVTPYDLEEIIRLSSSESVYNYWHVNKLDKKPTQRLLEYVIENVNTCSQYCVKRIINELYCSKNKWTPGSEEDLKKIINKLINIMVVKDGDILDYNRNTFHLIHNKSNNFIKLLLDKCEDILDINEYDSYVTNYIKYDVIDKTQFAELVKDGFELTEKHLELACLCNNYGIFQIIMKKGTKPNSRCLEYCYYNNNIQMIKQLMNNKIFPDENCIIACTVGKSSKEEKLKLINGIIENGGRITKDVLKYMIYENINFDFKRSGIKLDDYLHELCHYYEVYPSCFYDEADIVHKMRMLFRNSALPTIKKYMNKYNLKPDIYCLENVCARETNSHDRYEIADMIVSKYKIEPSLLSIYRTNDDYIKRLLCKSMAYVENINNNFRVRLEEINEIQKRKETYNK